MTWKTILAGAMDQGAAGLPGTQSSVVHNIGLLFVACIVLPCLCVMVLFVSEAPSFFPAGPFRQSIFEICQDLNRAALSPDTLLISNSSSNGSNSSGGAVSVKQPLLITCPNTRTQTGDEVSWFWPYCAMFS